MPPPPAGGAVAPRHYSGGESDDDGPVGALVDDRPVVADGRDHQRDSIPDEDADTKLGLAQIEYRLDRQSNFSVVEPRSKLPKRAQLLARTSKTQIRWSIMRTRFS